MKAFSCGDVVPGCGGRWFGASEDELLAEVAAHAREAHGVEEMSDELVEQVRAAIVPA